MTPDQTALIITAVTPMVLALLGGVGWLIKYSISKAEKKGTEPPEVTQGMPVTAEEEPASALDTALVQALVAHHRDAVDGHLKEQVKLRAEVARLRELLLRHDIDPDT